MPDQRNVRILRDVEEECWVVSVDEKVVELDQILIPLHLIMEVAECTESLCHDNPTDLDAFMVQLIQRWAAEGYTPSEIK